MEQSAEAQRRALAWGEQAAKSEGAVRSELEAIKVPCRVQMGGKPWKTWLLILCLGLLIDVRVMCIVEPESISEVYLVSGLVAGFHVCKIDLTWVSR